MPQNGFGVAVVVTDEALALGAGAVALGPGLGGGAGARSTRHVRHASVASRSARRRIAGYSRQPPATASTWPVR